jgi:hypothetical protein
MMNIIKIQLIIISILAGSILILLNPSNVSADRTYHFTFRVPVELNNIPSELRSWRIQIFIIGIADSLIAEKYHSFTVNRRYNGTRVVKFDAKRGKNPRDAVEYRVHLQVLHGGRWQNACGVIGPGGSYERDTSKPVRCNEFKMITR